MKVAIISNARLVHTQRWARAIGQLSEDIIIISTVDAVVDNLKVFDLQLNNQTGIRIITLFKKIRYILKTWYLLLKFKADIIHVHFLPSDITIFAFVFFKNVVISVWGSDITRKFKRGTLKNMFRAYALRRAKILTATTNFLASEAKQYCPAKKIHIIPFGVDTDQFNPSNFPPRNNPVFSIAFIKHLEELYGPHILIKAAKYLRSDVIIWMVGQGRLRKELEELARQLDLSNIYFKGFIPNHKLPELLSKIDLFVMPTVYPESFGVAAIEAQAMGIPVIASKIGGIHEAVLDGVTGILVEPNNPKALANTIDRLIADKKLYKKMKQNCRKFVVDRFNWRQNVRSMMDLYKTLL